jgi:hypothetical protein
MAKRVRTSQKKQGPGKVGARSGTPAVKRRTSRTVRHASKRALAEIAVEDSDRAEAKLADQTYRGSHPEALIEAIVLNSGKPGRNKRSSKDLSLAKKRAAEALQKRLEGEARQKAERKAKRRGAARALKKARQA